MFDVLGGEVEKITFLTESCYPMIHLLRIKLKIFLLKKLLMYIVPTLGRDEI